MLVWWQLRANCQAVLLCSADYGTYVFLSAKHLNSFKLVCVFIVTGFIQHFLNQAPTFWHNCSLHREEEASEKSLFQKACLQG